MKKKTRNMLLGLVAVIVAAVAGIAAYKACLLYTSDNLIGPPFEILSDKAVKYYEKLRDKGENVYIDSLTYADRQKSNHRSPLFKTSLAAGKTQTGMEKPTVLLYPRCDRQ